VTHLVQTTAQDAYGLLHGAPRGVDQSGSCAEEGPSSACLVLLQTCCVWPETPCTAVHFLYGMGYLPIMHLEQMLPSVAFGKTAALQCSLQHVISFMQSQVVLGSSISS